MLLLFCLLLLTAHRPALLFVVFPTVAVEADIVPVPPLNARHGAQRFAWVWWMDGKLGVKASVAVRADTEFGELVGGSPPWNDDANWQSAHAQSPRDLW